MNIKIIENLKPHWLWICEWSLYSHPDENLIQRTVIYWSSFVENIADSTASEYFIEEVAQDTYQSWDISYIILRKYGSLKSPKWAQSVDIDNTFDDIFFCMMDDGFINFRAN